MPNSNKKVLSFINCGAFFHIYLACVSMDD